LNWANLTGAEVSEAQLNLAATLEGVILPDGSTYEA
jgi:hypothetical protein